MPKQVTAIALLLVSLAVGCGRTAADLPPAPRAADPALARKPKRPGEILVRGEASPRSHGPFVLHGRYTVRFEQSAPEDPDLDFSAQTSFVAALDLRPEQRGPGSVRLFSAATRSGRRRISVNGRFYVDVAFGDFPYAIRFTPSR